MSERLSITPLGPYIGAQITGADLTRPLSDNQFEQLYIKYKQDMYAVAYGILKNKEDAEDAVHQSFLKIADNFSKVSQIPCHELKAYIVIICRNTAINIYRQNQNRAEHSTELFETDIVDESYFEKQNYDELLLAIKQLPQIYGLQIRNQPFDGFFIGAMHQRGFPQRSFSFGGFLREDVAGKRLAALDLSLRGHGKTFGRSPMCLHFWHLLTSFFASRGFISSVKQSSPCFGLPAGAPGPSCIHRPATP